MQRGRERSRFGGGSLSLLAQASAITLAAGGALYNPSDLSSLYQSLTGGSTGASGSPVGIMLDKSYMGGRSAAAFIAGQAELVTNGGFDADTNWTKGAGWTISGGSATCVTASSYLTQSFLTVGAWYQVSVTIAAITGQFRFACGNTSYSQYYSTTGTKTEIIRCTGNAILYLFPESASTCTIDNVSVKEIPGFHALAPSDAARPLLTVASGLAYLAPDGVDDWMNVTPTLNLGEAWWHVGGWRSDTSFKRPFATSASYRGAPYDTGVNRWQWTNSSDGNSNITGTGITSPHVFTVEQASTTSLSGRLNGAAGSTITPFDDSASAQGLALFSQQNTSFSIGIAGLFYGGSFCPGALTTADRAIVERYVAGLAGVTL